MLNLLNRVRGALAQRWWRITVTARLRLLGVRVDGRLKVYGWPVVSLSPDSRIEIGPGVTLCSRSEFTALGVARPVVIRTLREGATIRIGNDVGLSGTVVCAACDIEIGDDCLLGADVKIFDTDFHPIEPEGRRWSRDWSRIRSAPVRIGRNVFIGTGSMVCKGVTIGEGAVIGAGSVVTTDVPAYHIAAGNPARVLRAVPRQAA